MPFEEVEIVPSSRKAMPASVSLTSYRSSRPQLLISFSAAFSADAGIGAGQRFKMLLGTGEHAGLARFVASPDGAVVAIAKPQGSIRLSCGHVARFGAEPRPKEFCNAERLDDGTIEVVLPRWAEPRTAPALAPPLSGSSALAQQHADHMARRKRLGMAS